MSLVMASTIADGGSPRYLPPEYFREHASERVAKGGVGHSMGTTIHEINHNIIRTPVCFNFSQVLTDKKPIPRCHAVLSWAGNPERGEVKGAQFHYSPRVHRGPVEADRGVLECGPLEADQCR